MQQLIIPLNWTLGVLFLAVAILFPVFDDKMLTGQKKTVAEQMVERIAKIEQNHYQSRESYLLFTSDAVPQEVQEQAGLDRVRQGEFVYDVFWNDTGTDLIIRAQAATALVKRGSMPPLVYTLQRNVSTGRITQKQWQTLSGKKPGLF